MQHTYKEKIEEKLAIVQKYRNKKNTSGKDTTYTKNIPFTFTHALVELAVGTAVGAGFGYLLDHLFGLSPLFLFIGSIFGVAAGIYNVYNTIK